MSGVTPDPVAIEMREKRRGSWWAGSVEGEKTSKVGIGWNWVGILKRWTFGLKWKTDLVMSRVAWGRCLKCELRICGIQKQDYKLVFMWNCSEPDFYSSGWLLVLMSKIDILLVLSGVYLCLLCLILCPILQLTEKVFLESKNLREWFGEALADIAFTFLQKRNW